MSKKFTLEDVKREFGFEVDFVYREAKPDPAFRERRLTLHPIEPRAAAGTVSQSHRQGNEVFAPLRVGKMVRSRCCQQRLEPSDCSVHPGSIRSATRRLLAQAMGL